MCEIGDDSMKNIIVGGTVRSGKTTLANLISAKFGYSKVKSDTIVNAFDKAFPSLEITHRNAMLTREKYEPFLFEILNGQRRMFNIPDMDGVIAEGIPQITESKVHGWLPIMYGCNNFCTYCIVPYVRGR